MKKLIIITIVIFQIATYSQFSGGSGTDLDPYQVATAEDLDNIRNYLTSSFIQKADIDLGVVPWNEGEGWDPIGDYDWTDPSKSFSGKYDGNGFEITDMYINALSSNVGLFGSSYEALFYNMNVLGFDIISGSHIGGIVGIAYGGSISNCIATGKIDGYDDLGLLMGFFEGYNVKDCHVAGEIISSKGWVGGLIGCFNADSLTNCTTDVKITSEDYFTGGLIGYYIDSGLIENCYSICTISSTGYWIGGLIGTVSISENLYISNCFTKGDIFSVNDEIGGFIGGGGRYNTNMQILNCFSNCNLEGNNDVGGFIGKVIGGTTIVNSYTSGSVLGNSNVGGFIGQIDSLNTVSVTNSYWDTDTSGLLTTAGNLGEGRTTVEMTNPHAGNTYVDWDFTNIWVEDTELHNDGYPFLGWHDTSINNEQLTIDNYELEQNYPNPFNPITTIEFSVQNKAIVYLSVYNSNGQLIKNLVNGVVNAGMHSATFNADNLNSGVYYYQLKIDGAVKETKKMLYIR